MDYRPRKIDTSNIYLSEDLLELTEYLAKNTHDIWALERYEQGWKFGKSRDDLKKEHPCLVPYENLPESEKVFDRNTALEAIKVILALGYSIEIPELRYQQGFHKTNKNLLNFLKGENFGIDQLYHLWREHDVRSWSREIELYQYSAQKALEYGEPLLGYNIVSEGLRYYPNNVRLIQLQSLSLARAGASQEANKILLQLYKEFEDKSEETLGMIGRTYKDISSTVKSADQRMFYLRESFKYYAMSFELYESIWAGINLASLYLLMGEKEKAKNQAREVVEICLESEYENNYWHMASVAESYLIQENYKKALEYYSQAVKIASSKIGIINSTRKNALMVMRNLGTKLDIFNQIEKCLSVPKIIIFTGHRIDEEGRKEARFPAHLEKKVYTRILEYLKSLGPCIGYSSAANGADILFLEAMRELKNPCHIILPYAQDSFIKDSVKTSFESSWEDRFYSLTNDRNNKFYELYDQSKVDKASSYNFANEVILGLAKLKSLQLETLIYPMAVWHSDEAKSVCLQGGTTATLKSWYRESEFIEVIDLKSLDEKTRSYNLIRTDFSKIKELEKGKGIFQTKGILFSDTVNYTSLSDEELIKFEKTVLGMANEMIESGKYQIAYQNTWGDALHVIFHTIESTATFALDLNDKLLEIDWQDLGFEKSLQMRMALHAGQVIETVNPITNVRHYSGANVCRAARLEPLTPPGQVYCSQEFAALTLANGLDQFSCRYVGDLAMPKGFGIYPIFNLRRALR